MDAAVQAAAASVGVIVQAAATSVDVAVPAAGASGDVVVPAAGDRTTGLVAEDRASSTRDSDAHKQHDAQGVGASRGTRCNMEQKEKECGVPAAHLP